MAVGMYVLVHATLHLDLHACISKVKLVQRKLVDPRPFNFLPLELARASSTRIPILVWRCVFGEKCFHNARSPPVTQVALPKSCRSSATTGKPAPIPGVGIPDLPRGPDAWRTAIKQWEDPGASIGGKALKEWPEEWYTGAMRTITGVKRNMRKVIALEFYRLQSDDAAFLVAYPEASRGAKPLFDAIQHRRREERGEVIGRTSKNGRPNDRACTVR